MSAKNCITHSFACDCREAEFERLKAESAALKSEVERLRAGWDATESACEIASAYAVAYAVEPSKANFWREVRQRIWDSRITALEQACEIGKDETKLVDMTAEAGFQQLNRVKAETQLAVAVKVMTTAADELDGIKFDLEARVYTLANDEFETTFHVRDELLAALAKIGGG